MLSIIRTNNYKILEVLQHYNHFKATSSKIIIFINLIALLEKTQVTVHVMVRDKLFFRMNFFFVKTKNALPISKLKNVH